MNKINVAFLKEHFYRIGFNYPKHQNYQLHNGSSIFLFHIQVMSENTNNTSLRGLVSKTSERASRDR